jgi:hypothetical protein
LVGCGGRKKAAGHPRPLVWRPTLPGGAPLNRQASTPAASADGGPAGQVFGLRRCRKAWRSQGSWKVWSLMSDVPKGT